MKITRDNLTINNIKSFIRAYTNIGLDKLGIKKESDSFKLQVDIRAHLCSDCVELGECIYGCECKVPDLFHDPKRIDKLNRWGVMLEPDVFYNFLQSIKNEKGNLDIDTIAEEYSKIYSSNKNNQKKINLDILELDSSITNKNFGEVKFGDPQKHEFRFQNTSTKPIKINSISATCGCTIPKYKVNTVMPGEYYSFEIVFSGKPRGDFNKLITINIDNSDIIIPTFSVSGKVI